MRARVKPLPSVTSKVAPSSDCDRCTPNASKDDVSVGIVPSFGADDITGMGMGVTVGRLASLASVLEVAAVEMTVGVIKHVSAVVVEVSLSEPSCAVGVG